MQNEKFETFDEFWDFYVREHASKLNRQLHFVGSTAALALVVGALVTKRRSLLVAAPLVGYGFAWAGHFFVEKNRPASFKHPLFSFAADWKMWSKTLVGAMDAEVERVLADERRARAEATADQTVN